MFSVPLSVRSLVSRVRADPLGARTRRVDSTLALSTDGRGGGADGAEAGSQAAAGRPSGCLWFLLLWSLTCQEACPPAVRTDHRDTELCPKRWFAVSLLQVQGAQEVLEDPWGAWEAVEETEVASHQEGPAVPGGTRLEEETSSTEPETGSAPTRMYSPPLPSWRGLPAGFLCPEQPDPGPAVGWAAPSVLTSCPGAFGRRPHSPRDSGPPARACPDTQPDQTLVLCCAA